MKNDAARLVRALMGAEKGLEHHTHTLPQGCVVALSRDSGCGGEEVAPLLAQRLRVRCFDKELLDAVVRETHQDRETLERLDDRASGKMEAWIYSALLGRNASPDDYWRSMSRVILNLAEHGGVIVGRGAHLILARRRAFRVRLTGSLDICAERVAKKEGLALEEARKRVAAANAERHACILTHFHRAISDASTFDLVINTDRLENPAAVVEIILLAMRQAGFDVPAEEVQAHAVLAAHAKCG